MTATLTVRAPRQAAVLAAVAGLHAWAVILVVAVVGPRLPVPDLLPPFYVRPPAPPPPPEPATPSVRPVDYRLPPWPAPRLDLPRFDAPTATAAPDAERSSAPDRESSLPTPERVAPRLRLPAGRLAALVDVCYPPAARRRAEEGRLVVRLDLDAAGRVAAWHVVQSSGFPRLDGGGAACVVSRLAFHPGRSDGEAVAANAHVPIVFRLH